jgi:hypothetical protein
MQRLYVIASNQSDSRYRVLKIDRHYSANDPSHDLNITEDGMIYSKQEVSDLLKMIEDGNKTTGGLQKVVPLFYGMAGSSGLLGYQAESRRIRHRWLYPLYGWMVCCSHQAESCCSSYWRALRISLRRIAHDIR